jgi:hypothetical protein
MFSYQIDEALADQHIRDMLADARRRNLITDARRHDMLAAAGRGATNPNANPSLLKSSAAHFLALVRGRRTAHVASRTTAEPAAGPMGCLA